MASSGPLTLDCDEETMRFYDSGPRATCVSRVWLLTLKVWIIAQNLCSEGMTKNRVQENIRKVISVK